MYFLVILSLFFMHQTPHLLCLPASYTARRSEATCLFHCGETVQCKSSPIVHLEPQWPVKAVSHQRRASTLVHTAVNTKRVAYSCHLLYHY